MKASGMYDLQTDRGMVIGFGRVKVPRMPKLGFDYEIPLLSFVIIRGEGEYIATCIHLQLDGYGKDISKACNDMVSNILYYLRENFKYPECVDDAWENMYELSVSNPRIGILWDKYHALQYGLAKQGTATDRHSEAERKINELQDEVSRLESELKDCEEQKSELWDSYLNEMLKSKPLNPMIVEERMV